MNKNVEIKAMPELHLACLDFVGTCDSDNSGELAKALGNQIELSNDTKQVSLYLSDPEQTDPEKMKQSVCFVINEPVNIFGEAKYRLLSAGKFVVLHAEGVKPQEIQSLWEEAENYGNQMGVKWGEYPYHEIFHKTTLVENEVTFDMEICMPIA